MLKKIISAISFMVTLAAVLVYFFQEKKTMVELSRTNEPLLIFKGFDLERTDLSGKRLTVKAGIAVVNDDHSVSMSNQVQAIELSKGEITSSFYARELDGRFKTSSKGGLFGETELVSAMAQGDVRMKANDMNIVTEVVHYDHAAKRAFSDKLTSAWTSNESMTSQAGFEYFSDPQRITMKGQVEGQISPHNTKLR